MNYIVLDLEWNQAVSQSLVKTSPVHLSGEIIEIGAVKLNDRFEKTDELRLYVKPAFYKKLHWSVSKLTKITAEVLSHAPYFESACKQFFDWCGADPVFITWGPDDIPMLRNNMLMYEMDVSVLDKAYDAQVIYDLQIAKEGRQHGLSEAMTAVGEIELDAHDALNDALNTVAICRHLDLKKGIDEYPKIFNIDNFPVLFTDNYKYANFARLNKNQSHMKMICPACQSEIKSGDWIISGNNRKISLAKCACGKEYFLRFKLKKHTDDSISVLRIAYNLNDELLRYYNEKNEKYTERLEKYRRKLKKAKENKTEE